MARNADESRASAIASRSSHALRHRSEPCCNPTSGATTVRRSTWATGVASTMSAMIARMMATANNRMSARARIDAELATVVLRGQDGPVLLFVIENAAGAAHHARERILVHVNGKIRLLAEQQVEAANERAAAGHHDAAGDDVARELGWRDFQRAPDGIDDRLHRFLDRFADFAR